jgi:hypothetical protein
VVELVDQWELETLEADRMQRAFEEEEARLRFGVGAR